MSDEPQPAIQTAVIDRFEGALAVLLVGTERQVVDVPRAVLPAGVREGMWLKVEMDDGRLKWAELDERATDAARQRIQAKLDRLRRGDHLAAE